MHGFQEEMGNKVDVVHLNLASAVGREVGQRYGVRVVPASLLFGAQGDLIARVNGVPRKAALVDFVNRDG